MDKDSTNKINQENINSTGDTVGRDKISTSFTFNDIRKRSEYMKVLIKKYKQEQKDDVTINFIIEQLQHYKSPVDSEITSLEDKLRDSVLETNIEFSKRTKEQFFKKLLRNEYSESAQKIYCYVLAEIYSNFHMHVKPLLANNLNLAEINRLVETNIINPIQDILGENVLDILKNDINGMLFFLTGNCHIKWK